jgi:signal-transduction protein with cAMP-binding, CBS, and nucleotidyltransferase domain
MNGSVSAYTSFTYCQVEPTNSVEEAAKSMRIAGTSEAIVVEAGKPIGIITERDILDRVVAEGSNPSAIEVRKVMTSPLETIDEIAKVSEAIAKMSKLGVRRLGVTRGGKLVGMITQKALVSGDLKRNVPLPELASPHSFSCPYCDSVMKSKEELSKHIDQVHLGPGLLEGDRTKW